MLKSDTIAAVATPPGEGGLAVVRVSGPEARHLAARVFRPRRGGDPAAFPGYSVHYGEFADAATGEVADDGLLTVLHAPHSYTGEDTIELACHGGRMTTARVLKLILDAGARLAEPGEFTQRAFLNGRLDLAQAEAVADVIRARSESAHRMARRQLEGALSQAVAAVKETLIGILAAIEVTIDFSEEVGELEYEPLEARIAAARSDVERLLATAERGRILREGLRVAIVGKPNVGKSSLLNALLRSERAIVTPIAGTTRDLVEEATNIDGTTIVLVDTAGIRETADAIERIGVERAENAAAAADVVLFVFDATTGVTESDRVVMRQLAGRRIPHVLIVLNKCDAFPPGEAAAVGPFKSDLPFPYDGIAHVSALTGQNMDRLEQMLARWAEGPGGAEAASVAVANTRHRQALESTLAGLREAERTAAQRLPGDFIAIDVRGALDALGLITGETVTEDILDRIFRDFCVGK